MVEEACGAVGDPFEATRRYSVIYADPPWSYRDQAAAGRRGAGYKDPLLADTDIKALPVARLAADDALLFLWVTWPKLPEVLPVIDAWGFSYRTVAFVWVKRTRVSGALAWGMGSWTRANTEPCLLAIRGRPKRVSAGVHQVVEAPLTRHSAKPAQVRERIVALAGDVPRIELFAREVHPGWDAWGNQLSGSGEPVAAPDEHLAAADEQAARDSLIERLARHGPASRNEIAGWLGMTPAATSTLLRGLVREGRLARHGRARGTRYALAERPPSPRE